MHYSFYSFFHTVCDVHMPSLPFLNPICLQVTRASVTNPSLFPSLQTSPQRWLSMQTSTRPSPLFSPSRTWTKPCWHVPKQTNSKKKCTVQNLSIASYNKLIKHLKIQNSHTPSISRWASYRNDSYKALMVFPGAMPFILNTTSYPCVTFPSSQVASHNATFAS